jgi:L-ascorbate metabolism protein UlaG (beta-lactamase superfamily)
MSLLLIPLLIAAIFTAVGYFLSAPGYKGPVTDHFDGKRFINPGGVKAQGLPAVFKWMINRERSPWIESVANHTEVLEKPIAKVNEGMRITFVNHSTFLIQVEGVNILTDPVWSNRTSPFEWAGPRRMRPPGVPFETLPAIDLVLLSHNHYDHLDIKTLTKLWKRDQPKIITALGISAFLNQHGIENSVDLDWWDQTAFGGLEVFAVPAQHFSSRGSFDRDATLWCGFMVKLGAGYLYFAGDTGYNENTFKEIGGRFSPIDLSLIPIGAYKPQWFMSPIHCSPEEAVRIHEDVRSKKSIATHFGTFPLADDGQEEPVKDLAAALVARGIDGGNFRVLQEGKPLSIEMQKVNGL